MCAETRRRYNRAFPGCVAQGRAEVSGLCGEGQGGSRAE